MCKKQTITTRRLAFAALMAALTCAGSAIRITMPIQIADTTSIHLGNIMCALSGILLGPWLAVWLPVLAPPFMICSTLCTLPKPG